MTAWIKMIEDRHAEGVLKEMYDKVRTPHGTVDNVMRAHSLRPHTMNGHVVLYKSVLHNPDKIPCPCGFSKSSLLIPACLITAPIVLAIISPTPGV